MPRPVYADPAPILSLVRAQRSSDRRGLLAGVCIVALLSLMLAPTARSAISTWRADINIDIGEPPFGFPVYSASPSSEPYSFIAYVNIPLGGPKLKGDLYFGLISPDGDSIHTWSEENGRTTLKAGYHPIEEGLNLHGESSTTLSLRRVITGDEIPGMYLVFVLLVDEGRDPGDSDNWVEIEMHPLFVNSE